MVKYISEFIGSFFLVSTVIGSGIMGYNLSNGIDGIALLGNTVATGAILYVIIKIFSPISGAHFNPAVSLIFFLKHELSISELIKYILSQLSGSLVAVFSTHYIFKLNIIQISENIRGDSEMFLSEVIATFGLITTILFLKNKDHKSIPIAVALFITAGYWFTSSTSFANPAVTLARALTDTFTGIAPISIKYFIPGQLLGSILALLFHNLYAEKIFK
tara:strand:- start:543 stop:1196 length:654 start_codon:yes stop_codon:yes gene_type:complete